MNDDEYETENKFMEDLFNHLKEEAQANAIDSSIFFHYLFVWSALNMIQLGNLDQGYMNRLMKRIFDGSGEVSELQKKSNS